jgi:hypothetical protein
MQPKMMKITIMMSRVFFIEIRTVHFYVFNRLISIFLLDFEYPNAKIYLKDSSNNPEISDSLAFVMNFVKFAELNCISRKVQVDMINLINKQLVKKVCDCAELRYYFHT